MFEDYTFDNLLKDVLNNAPDGIDTRQGSIFYDAVAGILLKIAKLYTDLDLVFGLVYIDTASGEYLDKRAVEYGISRHLATGACYNVTIVGTTPDIGARFFAEGLYFTFQQDDEGVYYLECEEAGTAGNVIQSGTAAIPVNSIEGLKSATFGLIYAAGTDDETDDSLRLRVQEKISGPTENGNKRHYKYWCESVDGVAKARIFPLWNGPNTVKAILINANAKPCDDDVVEAVQEYIDPATNGVTASVSDTATALSPRTYTVGDGLGEGVANLGAHFTAAAAVELDIDVAVTVTLNTGYTAEQAQSEAATAISAYLQELVLNTSDGESLVVQLSSIGAIISGLASVADYDLSTLTINEGTANITAKDDDVPVLGEVTVSAA